MKEYQEYIKRLIIKIEKPIGRDVYNRRYHTIQDQLNPEVYEIAPNIKLGHFPGYQNVRMNHKEMQQVLLREDPSWKSALSYVKGIYVITDKSNGKLYIGSASGTVLIAMYGATIGKLGILTFEATTNQACCACIPFSGVYNKFLFYYLMSERSTLINMSEGGAQPNISRSKLVNFPFPLPPLEEQERIVRIIEENFIQTNKLKNLFSNI